MKKKLSEFIHRFQPQTYADMGIGLVGLMWGTSTIVTKMVLSELSPFAFQAARFWLAFFVLGALFTRRLKKASKNEWKTGILTGCALCAAYSLQLLSLVYTSVTNSAFIAALPVVIIPVLNAFLTRKLPSAMVAVSVSFCVFGLYLLTGWEGSFRFGDFLAFLCAFAYSVYTLIIDRKGKGLDGICVSAIQLLTVAAISSLLTCLTESFTSSQLLHSWAAIVFVGIFATALVTPLQVIGLKYTTPTRVGILLLLEPVSAAVLAFLFLHETLSLAGFIGCLSILTGLILAEWKHV